MKNGNVIPTDAQRVRIDMAGVHEAVCKLEVAFGHKPERVIFQKDLFPDYDEVVVVFSPTLVYSCLVSGGVQQTIWKFLSPEVKR